MATTSKQTVPVLSSVGIDIGKNVFHLVGFDSDGKVALRRKITRLALTSEFEKLPCRRRFCSWPSSRRPLACMPANSLSRG